MKTSEDEIVLRVDPVVMASTAFDYVRGDVIDLDTPRAKGLFEVMHIDKAAGLLTVRPHAKVTSGARPNRARRRALASHKGLARS